MRLRLASQINMNKLLVLVLNAKHNSNTAYNSEALATPIFRTVVFSTDCTVCSGKTTPALLPTLAFAASHMVLICILHDCEKTNGHQDTKIDACRGSKSEQNICTDAYCSCSKEQTTAVNSATFLRSVSRRHQRSQAQHTVSTEARQTDSIVYLPVKSAPFVLCLIFLSPHSSALRLHVSTSGTSTARRHTMSVDARHASTPLVEYPIRRVLLAK